MYSMYPKHTVIAYSSSTKRITKKCPENGHPKCELFAVESWGTHEKATRHSALAPSLISSTLSFVEATACWGTTTMLLVMDLSTSFTTQTPAHNFHLWNFGQHTKKKHSSPRSLCVKKQAAQIQVTQENQQTTLCQSVYMSQPLTVKQLCRCCFSLPRAVCFVVFVWLPCVTMRCRSWPSQQAGPLKSVCLLIGVRTSTGWALLLLINQQVWPHRSCSQAF